MQPNEPTNEEVIRELIENRDGRYVLVGTPEQAATGHALVFDTMTRMVSYFDENDSLDRDVVRRMLTAGARVVAKVPPASAPTEPKR
jgi:hypothetical protein